MVLDVSNNVACARRPPAFYLACQLMVLWLSIDNADISNVVMGSTLIHDMGRSRGKNGKSKGRGEMLGYGLLD